MLPWKIFVVLIIIINQASAAWWCFGSSCDTRNQKKRIFGSQANDDITTIPSDVGVWIEGVNEKPDVPDVFRNAITVTEAGQKALEEGDRIKKELLGRHDDCFVEVVSRFASSCDLDSWTEDTKTLYATMLTWCHVQASTWTHTRTCARKPTTDEEWGACLKSMQREKEIAGAYTDFRNRVSTMCFIDMYPKYQLAINEGVQRLVQNGLAVTTSLANLAFDVQKFREINVEYMSRLSAGQERALGMITRMEQGMESIAVGVRDIGGDVIQVKKGMDDVSTNVDSVRRDTSSMRRDVSSTKDDVMFIRQTSKEAATHLKKVIDLAERIDSVTQTPFSLFGQAMHVFGISFESFSRSLFGTINAGCCLFLCVTIWWCCLDLVMKAISISAWAFFSSTLAWFHFLDFHVFIVVPVILVVTRKVSMYIFDGEPSEDEIECPDDWERDMFSNFLAKCLSENK